MDESTDWHKLLSDFFRRSAAPLFAHAAHSARKPIILTRICRLKYPKEYNSSILSDAPTRLD